MTETVDRYAVIGNPVAHSKSPQIHSLFADETGQRLNYNAILAEIGQFAPTVKNFFQDNGKGLNITVPFKEEAWSYATQRSDRAQRAGAVNTLKLLPDGNVYGDTTDGVGLVRDLIQNHGIPITGRRLLIIGAGGAVRGVLEALLEQRPAFLLISNRTANKAVQLAEVFSELGNIDGCGLDELNQRSFDLVINATSASLKGDLPPLPDSIFNQGACSYDMMYAAQQTAFMLWSGENGAQQVYDGLGMLVEQAAESFYLWRGVRPQTVPVIEYIRSILTSS
jgi:shikimate dehydrogenase